VYISAASVSQIQLTLVPVDHQYVSVTASRMSYGGINKSIHDYARQKDVSEEEIVSNSLCLV